MKNASNAAAWKPLAEKTDSHRGRNGAQPNNGTFAKSVKCLKKQLGGHDGDGH